MKKYITTFAFALGLTFGATTIPTPADAYQRLSMAEAKKRCITRAKRFATDSVGPNGRDRSRYEVQSMYKRCIFGYTRKHVRTVPPELRR